MADATEDGPEGEAGDGRSPSGRRRDGIRRPGTGEAAPSPPDDLDAAVAASAEDADASVATASPAGADGPSDLPDPEDLDLVCGISEKLCREACEVASCCFEAEGSPAQCRDDPHCAGYLPCSEFYVDP
ncbi:hypothetical protein THAOC_37454 [Thalassiosira oceanica]|uniref:Uncharacterized protein n=1 Tax=Thalassiosira oceanica TaxID=159749 RepID=K0RBW6_THAOC|nr:hypothetical protein THAOC_37454 [Thalassiosira oceanica]|eukprot:EJK44042.1 hypothetical protein THAOC_37454 [Thalassiosira oceanica]